MKTIKTIMLLGAISLFTSIPYGAVEAGDCSNPKGFHEKMMCKLKGSSGSSVSSTETKVTKKTNTGDGKASWIKKFLGKKNNKVTGN